MKKIILFLFCFVISGLFAGKLQSIIDRADPGSKIVLPVGVFKGTIHITKPLILEGQGKGTVIDGEDKSSIINIDASNVTIRNLTVRNSGHQRYRLDSAIVVNNVNYVTIEKCNLENILFGIVLTNTQKSIIKGNIITSYQESVVDNRGDGIRLWRSHYNMIANNSLKYGRDLSLTRSNHNVIDANRITNGRYGVLIQMCKDVKVLNSVIHSNYVGILSRGSKDVLIDHNLVVKTHLATGTGMMLVGGKNIHVQNNSIMKHAQAFYIDSKAKERKMQRFIDHNVIALNNEAFHFHVLIRNNTIQYNNIYGNLFDVVKDIHSTPTVHNKVTFNYWDQYQGFDKDRNGIGDTPYQVLVYADKLWQFDPHLKFFYATPLLSIVNFIEKIAPFSEPLLLLEDSRPAREPFKATGALFKNFK